MSEVRCVISYARKDGEPTARRLRESQLLGELGELWLDRADMKPGKWWRQITDALDHADVLLLVLTPAALESTVVKKEWRHARSQGVAVFPIKGVPDQDMPYAGMPRWMRKQHIFDLDHEGSKLVEQMRHPPPPERVPFMAPERPDGDVRRSKLYDTVKGLLLAAGRSESPPYVTSLFGAPAFGKTSLAAALCDDEDVIELFDDGILWCSLGEQPDVLYWLNRFVTELTGRPAIATESESGAEALSAALADRNVLMVVDDVWRAKDLEWFLRGGSRCVRVVTTRQADVAALTGMMTVEVGEMDEDEAIAMFTESLLLTPGELDPWHALVQRLGRWPLILDLTRSALRFNVTIGQSLDTALARINQDLDAKGIVAFDQGDERSLASAINRSLKMLPEGDRSAYLDLGIFPEEVAIPLTTLAALWGRTEKDTDALATTYARISLLKFDATGEAVHLHRVFTTYLREQAAELSAVHHRLLVGWANFYGLPDSYAWQWLSYHLRGAARLPELGALLTDIHWLIAKLRATDVPSLIRDFRWLADDEGFRAIEKTIRLAAKALARDNSQLASQIVGRIPEGSPPAAASLRASALAWRETPWLCPLTPSLSDIQGPLSATLSSLAKSHVAFGLGKVALTPDGRTAVTAGDIGTKPKVVVWDLEQGRERSRLPDMKVRALAVSPDGRLAATVAPADTGPDGKTWTLCVWELGTGQRLHTLSELAEATARCAIAMDHRWLIAGWTGCSVSVWDLAGGRLLRSVDAPGDALALLPPDHQRVVSAEGKHISVWDIETGNIVRAFDIAGERGIERLTPTPDGRRVLLTTHVDWSNKGQPEAMSSVQVWDLASGSLVARRGCYTGAITALGQSTDGRYCALDAVNGRFRLWDIETGQERLLLDKLTILQSVMTPDCRCALSVTQDGSLKVWDLTPRASTTSRPPNDAYPVVAVVVTPDGCRAASAHLDGLKVWSLLDGAEIPTLGFTFDFGLSTALAADGRYAVTNAAMARVGLEFWVWDLTTGESLSAPGAGKCCCVAITPDSRFAASASTDGDLVIWDLPRRQQRFRIRLEEPIEGLALTSDGRIALAVLYDGTLMFMELTQGGQQRVVCRDAWLAGPAISHDGRWGLSANRDGSLMLWDLQSGTADRIDLAENSIAEIISEIAMTPDGRFAVVASDATLRLVDLGQKAVIALSTADNTFKCCAISPDGSHVVGGDRFGRVHLLRLLWPEREIPPIGPTTKGAQSRRRAETVLSRFRARFTDAVTALGLRKTPPRPFGIRE